MFATIGMEEPMTERSAGKERVAVIDRLFREITWHSQKHAIHTLTRPELDLTLPQMVTLLAIHDSGACRMGALADATPGAFNLVRMTLAFALLAVVYHRSWRGIRRSQLAAGAVVGLCLAAGYQFQTTGLASTTPSKSAFITGLVVVLVPLLSSIPALRPPDARRPRWNAWTGAVLATMCEPA